ncbi:GAP family protein [Pseudonocardia halophobica]|uniref:GAP family protein n=1 Tax=Pseudonocardia halophobica TaxID=29401 RepID=UPI003D94BB00
MGAVIGEVLPLAFGVAVSPIPIIAAILMLFSARAGSTSTGFLLGWVLGVVVATSVFTVLAGTLQTGGEPSALASWIKIGLGVLLVLVGIRQWRGRGGHHEAPKWMAAIDDFTFAKALGLGFLLSAVNPKNLIMAAGAGVIIGSTAVGVGGDVAAVAVFTVIASSTVAIPVIAHLVAAERMSGPLESARKWLQDNNAAVMATLILVIGAVLVGKGVSGL